MLKVKPTFLALLATLALSACAGNGNQATVALPTPTPGDAVTSSNPFADDNDTSPRVTAHAGNEDGGGGEGCEHRFRLNLTVEREGMEPWHGPGRFRVRTCMPTWSAYDGSMRVRLPDLNRAVNLNVRKLEDSTDADRHYIGRKLQHKGGDDSASLILWSVDAHVTTHSVHPYVRTNGTVTRLRTRWVLNPEGDLETHDDELAATFEGSPTNDSEPEHCGDL